MNHYASQIYAEAIAHRFLDEMLMMVMSKLQLAGKY